MLAKVAKRIPRRRIRARQAGKKLPSELYMSLTWDLGKKLTNHRDFDADVLS
jgi:hypothetical protein